MYLKLILLFIGFFCIVSIKSQENKIPDWFFNKDYYQKSDYAIGISDPDLDSISAEKQAILRALINHSILNKSEINSLSTYGLGNQNSDNKNSNTVENAVYTSIFSQDSLYINNFITEKYFRNKYNETFILLKFSELNQDLLNKFDFKVIRRLGFQKENNIFPVFIDEIELIANLNDSIICNYKINKLSNNISIKSELILNEKVIKISFPKTNFSYNNTLIKNTSKVQIYNKLGFGVWASFFINLIEKSSLFNNLNGSNNYNLASLNQGNLTNNNESENITNLNLSAKSIEKSFFNYKIDEIVIKENNLCLNFDFEDKIKIENLSEKKLNRKENKTFEQMQNENWQCIGYESFENAWKIFKFYESSSEKTNIVSSDEHISNNLSSGIFKSVLFSKFYISNQINSKLNSLSSTGITSESEFQVQNSKSVSKNENGKIWPYFIFYRKLSEKHFEIKSFFFYDN
ncbi:MAG: hypothetical protein JXR51_03750 [Bacteroidales bacterium]|nr:hypothetical protein [Bacteroidales bacterium]